MTSSKFIPKHPETGPTSAISLELQPLSPILLIGVPEYDQGSDFHSRLTEDPTNHGVKVSNFGEV